MSRNLFSEYKKRNITRQNNILIHDGDRRFLGDLFHPIGKRTTSQYFDDLIAHTNARILLDPDLAVGGNWNRSGEDQLSILKSMGLQPWNTVLDIGCGTLRAGKWFIDYLNSGCYTGIDISSEAINYAKKLIDGHQWGREKSPHLVLNDVPSEGKVVPLPENQKFDFIISFWSCYDMLEETFRQFLHESIDRMHSDSVFLFSWGPTRKKTHLIDNKIFQWSHSQHIVDEVAKQRDVAYSNLPIKMHRLDSQIVSLIEPKD